MTTNLMVFIAGDNDLDSYGTADITEMMSVKNTGDELTILVQQDQSKSARDSGTKRYVIRHGKKEKIFHLGETNTGAANTLTAFLKWGMENFEAERNIVVLWNHGGGTRDELFPGYENNVTAATMRSVTPNATLGNQPSFFSEELRLKHVERFINAYRVEQGEPTRSIGEVEAKSILFDDDAKDFLDNLELKQVFVDLDKKLDIVGFDACLMGMLEVVYQLREHTEIVIGSEELEPGKGWDYESIVHFLVDNPNASNEEVSRAIVDSFVASYSDQEKLKVTLSAVRTEKLKNVACLMNYFAHEVLRKESKIRSTFLSIVDATQTFDYQNNEQIYRDLKHFVLLAKTHYENDEEIVLAADNLLGGLEMLVLENQTSNFENAHGLSVYLPLMPNMSKFAINVFSALDINAQGEAPYWLKLFKQIGNLDIEANGLLGSDALDACVEESVIVIAEEVIIEEELEEFNFYDFEGLYFVTDFIKEGRKNEFAVKQLQALLNLLGERLLVDGDFGKKSTKAVKTFQENNALVVDGQVGTKSWIKLYEVSMEKVQYLVDEVLTYAFLSLSSNNRALTLWVQSLLYLLDRTTATTARYDEKLETSVIAFQLASNAEINGCVDEQTWQKLFEALLVQIAEVNSLLLKDEFIIEKALENELSPAVVKAVIEVESRGRGFNKEKQPIILFEGHKFWKYLKEAGVDPSSLIEGNEEIIYEHLDYRYYGRKQYPRLEKAKAINEEAALKSASYGMFQIMGFNHELVGFDNVFEMVEYLSKSEKNQLEAFMIFLRNTACYEDLKAKDWVSFARHYNGSRYRENQYDTRLRYAYETSTLTRGVEEEMNEELYVSMYAIELEKAFYEWEE
jgi:hypothetical protein